MGRLFAIEIIYRGIFQKTLATRLSRSIVLAAHQEGKMGISFGRYGDSPERNGIPAKNFAIVATDEQTLQEGMAKYEPKEVDVTIALDDTLCKGVESWAWYGRWLLPCSWLGLRWAGRRPDGRKGSPDQGTRA
jgi:pyruvate ferredoxin oxidoreductase delta subunit